jgi:hypothetical protein
MIKDLTYFDEDNSTVFTSLYLKNKGTCCKSACLHCPYGFTLKKLGLQFEVVKPEDHDRVEEILRDSGETVQDWKSFLPEHAMFILLKGKICGVLFKNRLVLKHLCLLPRFQHQGLSKELVESYYFI